MNEKAIACYVRVSTSGQNVNGQRAEIEKWLEMNSVDAGRVRWYPDVESGATLDRPGFERMQQDIRKGEISTVVVYKLDRLSRSLRGGINLLSDWSERGLRVVVVSQQIDFNGVVGKLIASLMLGLAEIELQHIRERQRAGIEAARAAGKYKGARAGFRKGDSGRAIELRNMGLTHAEVAKSLGVSTKTVSRYLKIGDAA
jgi:DNA invertase Pin-like site-specific DNA recombinase